MNKLKSKETRIKHVPAYIGTLHALLKWCDKNTPELLYIKHNSKLRKLDYFNPNHDLHWHWYRGIEIVYLHEEKYFGLKFTGVPIIVDYADDQVVHISKETITTLIDVKGIVLPVSNAKVRGYNILSAGGYQCYTCLKTLHTFITDNRKYLVVEYCKHAKDL